MYHSEHDANAFGFTSYRSGSVVHAARIAYPSACRASIKAAAVILPAVALILRHAI